MSVHREMTEDAIKSLLASINVMLVCGELTEDERFALTEASHTIERTRAKAVPE